MARGTPSRTGLAQNDEMVGGGSTGCKVYRRRWWQTGSVHRPIARDDLLLFFRAFMDERAELQCSPVDREIHPGRKRQRSATSRFPSAPQACAATREPDETTSHDEARGRWMEMRVRAGFLRQEKHRALTAKNLAEGVGQGPPSSTTLISFNKMALQLEAGVAVRCGNRKPPRPLRGQMVQSRNLRPLSHAEAKPKLPPCPYRLAHCPTRRRGGSQKPTRVASSMNNAPNLSENPLNSKS